MGCGFDYEIESEVLADNHEELYRRKEKALQDGKSLQGFDLDLDSGFVLDHPLRYMPV